MDPEGFKLSNIQKAIFLIPFFIFLLFAFEISAAKCNFPPAWNKAGTCTIDIYYEDPSGGSGLAGCYYTTESGISPSCPANGSWSTSCSCSGLSTTTCPVTISIGSTGDCNVNGTSACKICSKAVDDAGNTAYASASLNIDYQAPQTTIQCNGTACSADWYNADISITLSCSDSHSGCDKTYYCIDQTNSCSPGTLYTGAFNLTAEGTNYVRYYSTDIAGNIEPINSKTIKIDKTGPKSEFTDVATPPAGSAVASDFDVSVNDWDRPLGEVGIDSSGLADCYYSVYDSGVGYTKSGEIRNCNSDLSFTVTVSPAGDCQTIGGSCTISVYTYDVAGNSGDGQSRTFNISEATPPVTTLDEYLPDPTNDNTPTYSGVSTDAQSQVVDIEYRVDGGSWIDVYSFTPALSVPFTFTPLELADGTYTFEVRAKDEVGNWEIIYPSDSLTIDTGFPYGTLEVTPDSPEVGQDITITISANDGESGVDYLLAEDDGIYLPSEGCGGAASCDKSWIVQETVAGDHTYCGLIYDLANNINNTTPYCLTITVIEVDTTPPYRAIWDPLSRDCTNANIDISVIIQYADLDSGMAETRYCWTTGASCVPTALFPNPNGGTATQPSTGSWTLCVEAADSAFSPNSITECEGTYIVDKLPPNLPTFNPSSRDWSNEDVSVIVTYTDNLCGVTYTRHCWTEGASCEPGTIEASTFPNGTSITKSDNGVWTLCARARDGVGNWRSTDCFGPYQIDKQAPTVGAISPTTAQQGVPGTFSASVQEEISQILVCWFFVEGAFASAGVNYSDTPCTDCTVSVDYTFDEARDYDNVFFLCEDAAGNIDAGNPVTVYVEPPPSLSVDLVAVPPFGTGPLSDVDLIASVFGTITGTINYEFYCEDGGALTCSNIGVANTTYSLSQCITDTGSGGLCDYSVSSIAKVIIERGDSCGGALIECTNGEDCCRVRKVDIYIGGDQLPVCGISVPSITTVSTPIYIEVGSSYDPEEAMATVRFSSDDYQDGNPIGGWTQSYDWDISSGDWDATNKKMKWSFVQTGAYEVWTEVKDSVGQSVSCYDTVDVAECLPGDTKSCISGYGCNHTLTCTAQGNWPTICGPADECTPGSTQGCGISGSGSQTCTDSCIWGFCVVPNGCLWPPPSCQICQHPECQPDDTWSCVPDSAGTDCGDCLLCNDLGECNVPLCDWTLDSCECVPGTPDSCWNCNDYGTECGYQGVCSCGPLETPTWSCLEGACQCTCNLDLINCDEPLPGCQEDYPGVAIIPSRQPGTAGTSLTYTVFVVNNDSGQDCPDVTFNLTTGGICNDALWTCSLGLSQLVDIPPGQSDKTTLTATSPEPYSRGDYQISVTATRQ